MSLETNRVMGYLKALLPKRETPPFEVFKGKDGKFYWIARHTNNFEDREQEILSEKAHDAYIARLDRGLVPMPELWAWHTEGTRHGQADKVFRVGHIVTAVGHFDDTPEAEHARKYYQRHAGEVELSHGFTFPTWALKDGVYEVYNTFEISTLPIGVAANPYTTFEEVSGMALTDEKRQWLEATIGKDRTAKLLDENEKVGKAVEELGAKYKDFAEVETPAESEPEPEKKPADVAAFAQLLGDILEGQAHVVEVVNGVVDGQGKAAKAQTDTAADFAALQTQVKDLAAAVKAVQAELGQKPKAASAAQETIIEGDEAEKARAELPKESDNFWKV